MRARQKIFSGRCPDRGARRAFREAAADRPETDVRPKRRICPKSDMRGGNRYFLWTCPNRAALRAFKMTTIATTGLSTSGPPAATLSRAEVADAVRALSAADKTAVMKIARLYAKKTPYDHEDLLQEAICRVL